MESFDLKELSLPFEPQDIEWRIGQCGLAQSGKPWAKVLAYVQARAVMDRLDKVVGPENWRDSYREIKTSSGDILAVVCKLEIKFGQEWVYKEDAAEITDIEPVKGAFSGALKRAGSKWNIARYLYNLDSSFAECSFDKDSKYTEYAKTKEGKTFYWAIPQLPAWALPEPAQAPTRQAVTPVKQVIQPVRTEASILANEPMKPTNRGQLIQEIVAIARTLKMPDSELAAYCKELFGRPSMQLSDTELATFKTKLEYELGRNGKEEGFDEFR